jgi:urea transport system permease protein
LVGPILGAVLVNGFKSWFTGEFPEIWLFALGGLFIGVTLFLPRGIIGTLLHRHAQWQQRQAVALDAVAPDEPEDVRQTQLEREGA